MITFLGIHKFLWFNLGNIVFHINIAHLFDKKCVGEIIILYEALQKEIFEIQKIGTSERKKEICGSKRNNKRM